MYSHHFSRDAHLCETIYHHVRKRVNNKLLDESLCKCCVILPPQPITATFFILSLHSFYTYNAHYFIHEIYFHDWPLFSDHEAQFFARDDCGYHEMCCVFLHPLIVVFDFVIFRNNNDKRLKHKLV